jgi:hypothetical protein
MPKKVETPESANQESSLICSNSLPEFDDIEAEYAKFKSELAQPEEKPKRGRKKTASAEPVAPTVSDGVPSMSFSADQIEMLVCFPLDAWFERTKKPKLSAVERKGFSESCAKLANKWLPAITGQWQEEIGFAVCLGAILFVRMERKKEQEKPPEPPPKVG